MLQMYMNQHKNVVFYKNPIFWNLPLSVLADQLGHYENKPTQIY